MSESKYQKKDSSKSVHQIQTCCASRNLTLVEFIIIFTKVIERYSSSKIIIILKTPLRINEFITNEYMCKMLNEEGLCGLMEENLPTYRIGRQITLDSADQNEMPVANRIQIKNIAEKEIYWTLLNQIDKSDGKIRESKEVLSIRSLSIESWLSLYLAKDINNIDFLRIQNTLKKFLNLSFLEGHYDDNVKIKDKIDDINIAKRFIVHGNYREASKILDKLIHVDIDGYFLNEARYYSGICSEKLEDELSAALNYRQISTDHPYFDKAVHNLERMIRKSRKRTHRHKPYRNTETLF